MEIMVITHNEIPGFHKWEQAPDCMDFLRARHRHVFHVECEFYVTDTDREVEIILKQGMVEDWFKQKFGIPAEFGGRSCETIAKEYLVEHGDCASCIVREDGLGGAIVKR